MVGTFREPSCGRRRTPIHSIPYSVAQPLERGFNNYYSIIQGDDDLNQYFKIHEAENYAFYKVPKLLFTNEKYKAVSTDAKMLYG